MQKNSASQNLSKHKKYTVVSIYINTKSFTETDIYFNTVSGTEMLHHKQWSVYMPINYYYFRNQYCTDIYVVENYKYKYKVKHLWIKGTFIFSVRTLRYIITNMVIIQTSKHKIVILRYIITNIVIIQTSKHKIVIYQI